QHRRPGGSGAAARQQWGRRNARVRCIARHIRVESGHDRTIGVRTMAPWLSPAEGGVKLEWGPPSEGAMSSRNEVRVGLDVSGGEDLSGARPEPDTPFVLLVMGDFGGGGRSGAAPVPFDRDDV